MKYLYLIRHAKSSWKESGMTDRDRPLNNRGERDAPFMANIIKSKNIKPDLIITSDALRARMTAEIFAGVLEYPKEEIMVELDLYLASIHDFLHQIHSLDEKAGRCFMVSHNPGISGVINYLTRSESIDMPTCAVFGIEFPFDSWREIKEGTGKPVLFEYPKKYLEE